MATKDRRSRVMLVEDDGTVAFSLAAALTGNGFQVRLFPSTETALEASPKWEPQIALADLQLPGKDGLDLLHAIRRQIPDCRLFLISGSINSSRLLESKRGTLEGITILSKPIAPDRLLHLLWNEPEESRQTSSEGIRNFDPISTEEMSFALEFFFRVGSGQFKPTRSTGESGLECAKLFGEICYNTLAFRYEGTSVSAQFQLYTAFRGLWDFHEGDRLRRAICARVLVFHLMMERTSGTLVADWVLHLPDAPEQVMLDSAVISAMGQVRLNERWLTSDNAFLEQLQEHVHLGEPT